MREFELSKGKNTSLEANGSDNAAWICALDISTRTINNVELTEFSRGGQLVHRHGDYLNGALSIDHLIDRTGKVQAIKNSIRSDEQLAEILASGINVDGKTYALDYLYDKTGAKGLWAGDETAGKDGLRQLDPQSELGRKLIVELHKINFEAPCKKK